MPLARIITHSAQAAAPVIKRLKARGYTVETVLPGESCDKPADLEIVLEKTNSDAVLSRATDLVQATNGNVYIGAGTFRARRVEVPARESQIARSLPVPSVEDTVNGVAAGLQNKRDLLAKALWEQRANMREARRLQRERVHQEQMRVAAEAERLRIEQEDRARVNAAAEAERQRVSEIAARENAERAERERAKQLEAERQRAEQSERHQAERERILAEHAEADRLFREEEAHLAQQDIVESVEPAEVHDVPGIAYRGTEEAQLAPAASVESASAGEVVVPGLGSGEERQDVAVPVEMTGSHVAAAPPLLPVPEPHGSRHRPRLRLPHRDSGRGPVRARTKEWRAAIIVSSIFALVLMLAWRVVTRGPVSPLPAGVTNQTNLQQEVPFGGVTLTPPGTNLPGTLAPASHPGGKVLRPISADLHGIARPQPTSTENSAGQAVANKHAKPTAVQENKKAKPLVNRKSRLHRHSEDEIAEDEVIIRHFTPKPAAPPAEQKASLKKYSDLD